MLNSINPLILGDLKDSGVHTWFTPLQIPDIFVTVIHKIVVKHYIKIHVKFNVSINLIRDLKDSRVHYMVYTAPNSRCFCYRYTQYSR